MHATCPVCTSSDYSDVLALPAMPVLINAQVRPDRATDVARGDIDLVVCRSCGHLFNRSYDDSLIDYDAAYENTLHYSPRFQKFARDLAARLITDHGLVGTDVAELGSGPGHFLSMLCDAGVGRGFGFDPSYDQDRLGAPEHRSVSVTTELFPADGRLAVAFAFSQHVLEHLGDPVEALRALRSAVAAAGGVVYSEVPNGQLMVDQCALWDLIYEHRSFFTPTSLAIAYQRAGLDVGRIESSFGDQFLWCEGVAGETPDIADGRVPGAAPEVVAAVARAVEFGSSARRRIVDAADQLAAWIDEGPVALWGAGSKGMTYLNLVAGAERIAAVVDINPRKAGWGVPGTSHVIAGAEVVADVRPRVVLAANPEYVSEIEAQVSSLGVRDVTVVPLWSSE